MTSTSQPPASKLKPLILADAQPALASELLSGVPLRQQIRQWMVACRQLTLALFTEMTHDTLCQQAHPDFSPVGWHLGHIGYTEGRWILEHCAGFAPQLPEYQRLFAADTLPKRDRVNLPTLSDIQAYLEAIRTQVFDYLETAPLAQQERLWRWLLQHESQHCETIALVLQLQQRQQWGAIAAALPSRASTPTALPPVDMVQIPAGVFEMGSDAVDALDNERPAHRVELATYWIDRTPVTCGHYRPFIEAGGYHNARWWSEAGWQWRQANQVMAPLYWSGATAQDAHPVCGVSWYEAEAYANFVGKRLPTEAEWEKAARWQPATGESLVYPWGNAAPTQEQCNCSHWVGSTTPVESYPQGMSPTGCLDLLGNSWEWTASWFEGYPGFTSYPYQGYSQVYFDGEHRVLRGGSWATRPWALRASFRNWYYPHMREMLVGFRCASDRPR